MEIKNWIKTHKIAAVGIVIGIIIVGLVVSLVMVSLSGARHRGGYTMQSALESPGLLDSLEKIPKGTEYGAPQVKGEIEVKEGSMKIESKKAEDDFAEIKSITEGYQGYIERSSKSTTNLYIQINLTLRVPSEKFVDLVKELKKEFKVDSYNIRNYRISIEGELDEFQILKESLSDYEDIREEIKEMRIGKDKIDLLMQLTDKELQLKKKEKGYQREISSQERRGEYANLNVTIKEKKSPKIWPEDVSARFKDRLRNALDNTVEILNNLVGGTIELFFRIVQIAVYIFVVGIVLAVFYRLCRGLFRRIIGR